MHDTSEPSSALERSPARWWREWEVAALGMLVLATYFTRLSAAPVCGEESRWATSAREMIASGDWVVPRQQGTIFPERPPLGSWAMAVVGLARGQVDLVTIRLPSAVATLLLTWLIYGYARAWISRLGSFCAAAMYATFAQVLVLGRFGESEALFTLFTAAALLVWHAGYVRGWPIALTWSAGYSLAALAALVKGPQAPVYFVSACCGYLLLKRDWRWLVGRGHLLGLVCFAVLVGAWMVPFARSHWESIDDIWAGLARERFTTHGLAMHLVSFPIESLACLLPWSPLLVVLVRRKTRESIAASRPQALFLVTALVLTYPSVWLAAGARGRYYMPLYPCLAVLMGLVVEHCTASLSDRADRLAWRRYLRGLAAAVVAGATALVVVNLVPLEQFVDARQPWPFLFAWCAAALATAGALGWASRDERSPRPQVAVLTLAGFLGLTYVGVMINARVNGGNDLTRIAEQIQRQVPTATPLVSLGRVYHRFAYSYTEPIRQIPWPATPSDVPAEVTYFCFDRRPGTTDPPDSVGSGGHAGTTAALPFAWDKIAEIACDPVKRKEAHRTVVVGRIRRAESLAEPRANPTAFR